MPTRVDLQRVGMCFLGAAQLLLLAFASARAQTVVSTIPVGHDPVSVAVNPATNQTFVANFWPHYLSSGSCVPASGAVSVIDGTTLSTHTVGLDLLQSPVMVAVNSTTDKSYVVSPAVTNLQYGTCNTRASVAAIDGTTLNLSGGASLGFTRFPRSVAVNEKTGKVYVAETDTALSRVAVFDVQAGAFTTVQVGLNPIALAVDPATNKIYVANQGSNNVSVIDGATNGVSMLGDPNAITPVAVAVNPGTNKIYVANKTSDNVSVIDGTTNSIITVSDPHAIAPNAVSVNATTNKIYVVNSGSDNVTVIDGATNAITTLAVGVSPVAVAVNPETDRTYVANSGNSSTPGSVTVIDGKTNSTTTLIDPKAITPTAVAVNSVTDEAYVANSGSNNVTVISGGENFSLASASANLTVQRGGQITDVMTIAGINGPFGSPIELTCAVTGPAPLPSCTLSPSSVTPGSSSVPSILTITAAATAAGLVPPDHRQLGRTFYALLLPLVFGTVVIVSSKRQGRSYRVLCGSLLLLWLLQSACGGNSSSNGGVIQGPTNHTVTVSGISGAIQHSAQVALTVQ